MERTLSKAKLRPVLSATGYTSEQLKSIYESIAEIVIPEALSEIVVKADPSDDAVIATAIASHAEFNVSGNSHLLDLKYSFNFRIITPAMFLHTID